MLAVTKRKELALLREYHAVVASCANLFDIQFLWKFHESWLEDLLKLAVAALAILAAAPSI